MLTFQTMYTRVADLCGFSVSDDTQDVTNAKQDINQALRLFKNTSRRYWTRKEVTADLVAGQQYYTFPEDMVRITQVKANTGGYNWPLIEVDSEKLWNKFNVIPSNTVIVPQFYFVRGRNEIGIYPIPSGNETAGLVISYEPRLPDMSTDDVTTTTVTVTSGSQLVTSPSAAFSPNMANNMWFSVTDGSDGNWYPIISATSSQLTLENYYQGPSESGAPCIIGPAADIPEDFQMAPIYFAAYNFYLKRNETANATLYKGLYEDLLQRYIEAYAAKSTGLVQKPLTDNLFNIFWLPPGIMTG